ncbi:hypothetical protein CN526_23035 [Bacillus wiedmannii]|uniref:hypothetical protein n=1 Tax=Bacillus wiedmannii TaxID=1890302 RepID=UPI000BF63482|nr:hypothetical protein [Bacillus wiedmannii]PEU23142.1 hypothetical protein CN526_23035 [Bacillus wiedmannii]
MASVNNNAFKVVKNKYEKLEKAYEELMEDIYYSDGTFKADHTDLWDAMWTANDLYVEITKSIFQLEGLLSGLSHFNNKPTYDAMLNGLKQLESDIISEYKNYKDSITNLSGGFTDSEQTRITTFVIEGALY